LRPVDQGQKYLLLFLLLCGLRSNVTENILVVVSGDGGGVSFCCPFFFIFYFFRWRCSFLVLYAVTSSCDSRRKTLTPQ
jgi:hypothetical protein